MPQLWLTYQELAEELDCDARAARETSILHGWTRKHSSDGNTRVLMPQTMMMAYMANSARGMAGQGLPGGTMLDRLAELRGHRTQARNDVTPAQRFHRYG